MSSLATDFTVYAKSFFSSAVILQFNRYDESDVDDVTKTVASACPDETTLFTHI